MSLFGLGNLMGALFGSGDAAPASAGRETDQPLSDPFGDINPATGLPMIGAIDVEGNPYGVDLHSDDFSCSSPFDDGSGLFGCDSWSNDL